MKTIGLIGGMSFDSTVEYYKIINTAVRNELGKNASAKILLHSMNFQEIVDLQFQGEWEKLGSIVCEAAIGLEKSGADFILICTNLMHKVVPIVEKKVSIPIIHIADVTSMEIKAQKLRKVALLGTIFTMEEDFYKNRIESHGIEVILPDKEDRQEVSRVIYEELCRSIIKEDSQAKYEEIIEKMIEKGAEGVILGCTEIPLLLEKSRIPLFNTTEIHALSAVKLALEKRKEAICN